MISRIDHIAVAVSDYQGAVDFFSKIMGIVPGASATEKRMGFLWQIFSVGDLSRLEILAPVGDNSFLTPFLAKKEGGGVHHITLETPDLEKARQNLEHHAIPYFGCNSDNPSWKELFIHPRDAFGVLIQIAEFNPGEYLNKSLSIESDRKWHINKTEQGGSMALAHPGGGKVTLDLTRQEAQQLIGDLQKLL